MSYQDVRKVIISSDKVNVIEELLGMYVIDLDNRIFRKTISECLIDEMKNSLKILDEIKNDDIRDLIKYEYEENCETSFIYKPYDKKMDKITLEPTKDNLKILTPLSTYIKNLYSLPSYIQIDWEIFAQDISNKYKIDKINDIDAAITDAFYHIMTICFPLRVDEMDINLNDLLNEVYNDLHDALEAEIQQDNQEIF